MFTHSCQKKKTYKQIIVHIGYQLFYERINLFKGLCSEGNFYIIRENTLSLTSYMSLRAAEFIFFPSLLKHP